MSSMEHDVYIIKKFRNKMFIIQHKINNAKIVSTVKHALGHFKPNPTFFILIKTILDACVLNSIIF